MTKPRMLRALIVRPGEKPEEFIITDSAASFQEHVGGDLEAVRHRGLTIYVNESGRIDGLPFNRRIGPHEMYGTIIILGALTRTGRDMGLTTKDLLLAREIAQ